MKKALLITALILFSFVTLQAQQNNTVDSTHPEINTTNSIDTGRLNASANTQLTVTDSLNEINNSQAIIRAPLQSQSFKVKPWIDIPVTLATGAWSIYAMGVIYNRDSTAVSDILRLDRNKVNKFD